jgi:general secretion pathway protein E
LVLSTLHTNTAIGAITRLKDMGVEPFLLASSLEMVMAQRLVRVLCKSCRIPHQPTKSECERLSISPEDNIYQPQGCEKCKFSGYRGRAAIYELISVDSELRQLIHEGVGEQEMLKHARKTAPSLMDDGRRRVLAGETSVEEVLRVTAVS